MLGVKSTSKDRWRQVLTEADRIPQKHLCTLEAVISAKQTDEMPQLTLVVPAGLHAEPNSTPHPGPLPERGGEGEAQRAGILSVADFVEFVRRKQA